MAADDVDDLEALEPMAQVEALNRRLFGKRSEKIPTVRQELREQV